MKMLYIKKILVATFIIITIGTSVSYAIDVPTDYTPLAPLPNISSSSPLSFPPTVNFQNYVTYAFNLLIAVAAVMAVFMITMGGFEYMTSDAVQKKSDGLEKVKNAIYGLLLVLSSYLILKTINPQFVSIPSTLVAPLNLNQKVNQISDWEATLKLMEQQAAQNSISAAQANNAAIANITQLQQQLATAQSDASKACADLSSDACKQAALKVSSLQDQLNTANATKALTAYDQSSAYSLHTVNSGGSESTSIFTSDIKTLDTVTQSNVKDLMNLDDTKYNASLQAINANGADPSLLNALNNSHVITQAQLSATFNYLGASPSNPTTYQTAIDNITSIQNTLDSKITDPLLKSQNDAILNAYLTELKNHKPVSPGSIYNSGSRSTY